jgi:hypothetical protein
MFTMPIVDVTAVISARAILVGVETSQVPSAVRTRLLRRQTRVALVPAPSIDQLNITHSLREIHFPRREPLDKTLRE